MQEALPCLGIKVLTKLYPVCRPLDTVFLAPAVFGTHPPQKNECLAYVTVLCL